MCILSSPHISILLSDARAFSCLCLCVCCACIYCNARKKKKEQDTNKKKKKRGVRHADLRVFALWSRNSKFGFFERKKKMYLNPKLLVQKS